jgi:hypothetical protein
MKKILKMLPALLVSERLFAQTNTYATTEPYSPIISGWSDRLPDPLGIKMIENTIHSN